LQFLRSDGLCAHLAMFFGCLARLIERAGGVFMRLTRKLVGGEAALAVCDGSSGMGMCGKVVELSGSVMYALRH
jgi:hypothetical protein